LPEVAKSVIVATLKIKGETIDAFEFNHSLAWSFCNFINMPHHSSLVDCLGQTIHATAKTFSFSSFAREVLMESNHKHYRLLPEYSLHLIAPSLFP